MTTTLKAHPFRGVIFDMDGTLTRPAIDFGEIRRELGLGAGDLAMQILALPDMKRKEAWEIIERHEADAMRQQELQDGVAELLAECGRHAIRVGVVTRNARPSVDHLCRRFGLAFDAVITRDFAHIKPHPEPVLHILRTWEMESRDALMVGDYLHDIQCGRAADTWTCFFQNRGFPDYGAEADYTVHSMHELRALIFPEG